MRKKEEWLVANEKEKIRQTSLTAVNNSFFLTAILLILQVVAWSAFYFLITNKLGQHYAVAFQFVLVALTVLMISYIVLRCPHNSYQIAWLTLLALMPAVALIMYIVIRLVPGTAHLTAQVHEKELLTELHLVDNEDARRDLAQMDNKYVGFFRYLATTCRYPTYYGKDVTYFSTGEEAIEALFADLEKAEKFIFMEYFIVHEGKVMDQLLDILSRKAAEGVEVRFMYDGLCGLKLPKHYVERINEMGIQCCVFSPIRPILSSYQNNRDHRKITVIDGKVGYTGGFNLADEYANLINRFGYWKDAGLRITGNGVQSLTAMFMQVWDVAADWKTDAYGNYMHIDPLQPPSDSILAPYADAPENNHDTASNVYCQLLDLAEDYVHIMTPYLILDERLRKSLEFAAQRGIEVVLMLPHIPDKKIVFMIARSYYPELLRAGIKIYEFTPGFLHSKMFVSDDCVATVGSVNLDFRSLFLHFENGVLLYDREIAAAAEEDFQQTLAKSERIYLKTYGAFPLYKRAFGRLMRVFGPLM